MNRDCTKCPNCAGTLELSGDGNAKICPYCGSIFQVDIQKPDAQFNVGNNNSLSTYSIKLISCSNNIKTIKKYREITDADLRTAKDIIDSIPAIIFRKKNKAEANRIADSFKEIGCTVELVNEQDIPASANHNFYGRSPEDIAKEKCVNFNPPESLPNMEIGSSLNISGSRKYKKAKVNFDIPDGEDVYIIYDSTLFGSCKKGFALCRTGIYYCDFTSNKGQISWNEFHNTDIGCKDGNAQCLLINGAMLACIDIKYVLPLLQSIQSEIMECQK